MNGGNIDTEWLIENEMAITFHIKKIQDYVADFNFAYDQLIDLHDTDVSTQKQKDNIWSYIELAALSAWKLAQTFLPETRGRGSLPKNIFAKKRGEQLRALFAITINDKKVIGNFRNRLMHIDEDCDEWFQSSKAIKSDRELIWRKLANGISPVCSRSYGVAQWYDYGWGVLHSFGYRFSLRAYKNGIALIESRLLAVDKYLNEILPTRTRVVLKE